MKYSINKSVRIKHNHSQLQTVKNFDFIFSLPPSGFRPYYKHNETIITEN